MTDQNTRCFLGVDGGGSKTVAAVSDQTGRVLGRGTGPGSELYRFGDVAFDRISSAAHEALAQAGVTVADLAFAGFSLAGADWPEDYVWAKHNLEECGFHRQVIVNDAIGALCASLDAGPGIVIACGTGAAVGGRNAQGETWYSGHWQESGGALNFVKDALRQIYRAELQLEPPTLLKELALRHFGQPDVESLLHMFTRRTPTTAVDTGGFAADILNAAEQGDRSALRVVDEQARVLADYAVAAAKKLGLSDVPLPVFLTGGVFQNPSPPLSQGIAGKLRNAGLHADVQKATVEPVMGALVLARQAFGTAD